MKINSLICLTGIITLILMTAVKVEGQCAIDVIFIIDSSGSMNKIQPGVNNWNHTIDYMKAQIGSWNIGLSDVRVGVVTFGNDGKLRIKLDESTSEAAVFANIDMLDFLNHKTNLPAGLKTAREMGFLPANGARDNVRQVAIIVTDGEKSVMSDPAFTVQSEGPKLKDDDVNVFLITLDEHFVQRKSTRAEFEQIPSNSNQFLEYSDFSLLKTDAVSRVNRVLINDIFCLITGMEGNSGAEVNDKWSSPSLLFLLLCAVFFIV